MSQTWKILQYLYQCDKQECYTAGISALLKSQSGKNKTEEWMANEQLERLLEYYAEEVFFLTNSREMYNSAAQFC